ncbi:hypothetical protein BT96DRAFT_988033 [Gymnopus androsaceus JB14]|uniref:Uncharacterized protein n=1 Tax=Gymnopus androsaceus JB14 TaxID=1447944 RepID=A0A6A4I4X2_9AGAR|nr:hypothetical protein BT96DRAFT_988033 [Gymnopus androsaceus JB14]
MEPTETPTRQLAFRLSTWTETRLNVCYVKTLASWTYMPHPSKAFPSMLRLTSSEMYVVRPPINPLAIATPSQAFASFLVPGHLMLIYRVSLWSNLSQPSARAAPTPCRPVPDLMPGLLPGKSEQPNTSVHAYCQCRIRTVTIHGLVEAPGTNRLLCGRAYGHPLPRQSPPTPSYHGGVFSLYNPPPTSDRIPVYLCGPPSVKEVYEFWIWDIALNVRWSNLHLALLTTPPPSPPPPSTTERMLRCSLPMQAYIILRYQRMGWGVIPSFESTTSAVNTSTSTSKSSSVLGNPTPTFCSVILLGLTNTNNNSDTPSAHPTTVLLVYDNVFSLSGG